MKTIIKKNKLFLFYLMLFITKYCFCETIKNELPEEEYAIIFVHGTYGIDFNTLLKIIFYNIFNINKLKKLFNEITQLRFNKKLSDHTSVCSNTKGLDKISNCDDSHYTFKYVLSVLHDKFETLLKTKNIEYYSFNWNGCLSNELRKKESKFFYKELNILKKKKPNKKIIIIAFSHGGNIVLDMAKIAKRSNYPFIIDQLILLATPIGKTSELNTQSIFFPRIINFYSIKDFYQISDISFNFPNTKRVFNNAKNIINIDFRILKKYNKKKHIISPDHKYFGTINPKNNHPVFLHILPNILEKIDNSNYNNNYIVTVDTAKNINKNRKKNFKIKIRRI